MKIEFEADRIDIRTRKSDDAIIITMETGEYETSTVSTLFQLPKNQVYKITVEVADGFNNK